MGLETRRVSSPNFLPANYLCTSSLPWTPLLSSLTLLRCGAGAGGAGSLSLLIVMSLVDVCAQSFNKVT
jgi:hypothetical protein